RWFWEIIDKDTRFMVASLLSESRGIKESSELFRRASQIMTEKPDEIITDKLQAYRKAFNKYFYDHHQSCKLIQFAGVKGVRCNNIVERLHGTLKDRLRPARGMDIDSKTDMVLDGWWVHYNFVRPHSTLKGKTPAEVAGCELKIDRWRDLIEMATNYNDNSEYTVTNKLDYENEATTEA
ncbi:MAG: DDE-type integrase/transposase/recombinase, partial [Promethearchaeota archaeon]